MTKTILTVFLKHGVFNQTEPKYGTLILSYNIIIINNIKHNVITIANKFNQQFLTS